MAEMEWRDAVEILNEQLPILPADSDYPSLTTALDQGLNDLLRDSLIDPSRVNPRYVEDLLRDCVNRISNCLILREKAQDIELRAIGDAIAYKGQAATLAANELINKALNAAAPRTAQYASAANINGDKVTFESDPALWQKVGAAQDKLQAELADALAIQRLKASTVGNGSNFVERFAFLKRMFDMNIVEAYRRAHVCAKALKQIYDVNAPVPTVTPQGYLDKLAEWAQRASDALDESLDTRLYSDVAFAISGVDDTLKDFELIKRTKFNTELVAGRVGFTLTQQHFDQLKMANPLLRSVRLQVRAKDEGRVRIWPAHIQLPKGRATGVAESFPCVAPTVYQDTPSQDAVVRSVHNISPIGDWEIRLPDRAITADATNTTEVLNVYLFLRISYVGA